ncbi:hypothetical protein [Sphingomonas sp. 8AM]|uniref:hypothetical protein n=1 Tax=Sphingomonas sp. 8AM TaxID=2653170 RepID=UPI0012F4216B|nr:hypothetical protein [Sphingomonas sp. 8AM]VXC49087.1 hypothetical protein SPHINGO8AM_130314 [Sphingomonas sp. 8AM]
MTLLKRVAALEAQIRSPDVRLDMTGLTDDELVFVETLARRMLDGYDPTEAEADRWRDIDSRIVRSDAG